MSGIPGEPIYNSPEQPIYDNPIVEKKPTLDIKSGPPQSMDNFPELPSVPANSLPPGTASSGGEDVDFDELTRRFEDLKKRK